MAVSNVISLQFNSIYKDSGSSLSSPTFSNFNIDDIQGYRIKNAVIPSSFYTIDSRNNKFYFNETSTSSTTRTATITTGYYTSSTILTALKTALDSAGSANTYTITYSSTTNKITITSSTENFRVISGINNIYYELGIDSADLSVFATIFTPTNQIDLSGVKLINIVSNYFGNLKMAGSNYRMLGSIVCEEESGSISTFENMDNEYIKTTVDEIQNITFLFFDERNRELQINKDFVITMSFLIE